MRRELLISLSILFGATLLISGGFYWFNGSLTDEANNIASLRASLAGQSRSLGVFAELKRDSSLAAMYQEQLDVLFLTKDQLIEIPSRVQKLSEAYDVVVRFAFENTKTKLALDGVGSAPFTIDIDGRFNDVTNFLGALESADEALLLGIDSFDITRTGTNYRIAARGQSFFKETIQ